MNRQVGKLALQALKSYKFRYLFSEARTFLSAATSERQQGEICRVLSAKTVAADRNGDRKVRAPR